MTILLNIPNEGKLQMVILFGIIVKRKIFRFHLEKVFVFRGILIYLQ